MPRRMHGCTAALITTTALMPAHPAAAADGSVTIGVVVPPEETWRAAVVAVVDTVEARPAPGGGVAVRLPRFDAWDDRAPRPAATLSVRGTGAPVVADGSEVLFPATGPGPDAVITLTILF